MCNNIAQTQLSYALKCSLHMKEAVTTNTSEKFIRLTYLFTFCPSSNKLSTVVNHSLGVASMLENVRANTSAWKTNYIFCLFFFFLQK